MMVILVGFTGLTCLIGLIGCPHQHNYFTLAMSRMTMCDQLIKQADMIILY